MMPDDWPLTNLQYCIARALGREALEGPPQAPAPLDIGTVNRNSPEALEEGKGTE